MLTIIIELLLSIGIIGAGVYIKKINQKIWQLENEINNIKWEINSKKGERND